MSGTSPNANLDDEAWRNGKTVRNCYCGAILYRTEYVKHLKDDSHNAKMPGKPKVDK